MTFRSTLSKIITVALCIAGFCHSSVYGINLKSEKWEVETAPDGKVRRYAAGNVVVPFREDAFAGPSWEGVDMRCVSSDSLSYVGEKEGIEYSVKYIPMPDHLAVECTITNRTDSVFAPERASFNIGIDSEMQSYPQWNDRFFPTLMRCEKDFAWGYFMSPQGKIMAVGVEEPVASYSLQYIYRDIIEWRWGHRIFTGAWDMLHCGPLPERHPQNLDRLNPGESRSWTIHLGTVDSLAAVKLQLAQWIKAPMIELDAYTIKPGEECGLTIHASAPVKYVELIDTNGNKIKLAPQPSADSGKSIRASIPVIETPGLYRIVAIDAAGKRAEASLHVRRPWDEYLRQARDMVAENPPLVGNSCESFYGYYPAFLAARHYPSASDSAMVTRLEQDMNLLVDTITGHPAEGVTSHRIQNFSTMMGILADLYEATDEARHLEIASRIGDFLSSGDVQFPDGSYRAGATHYTAVIYPAKSMLELAEAELAHFKASGDSVWLERAHRHKQSALAAIADLAERRDNIATEGEMTFEDGMISCSALQLAMGATVTDDPEQRRKFLDAAEYMLRGHRCLEQDLIPDARMRGATLRYWEALDIYFSPNQVMNSPHGWTAWKIYALYYLYLLTGDETYMRDMTDTLGACVQLMAPDGHLRWGFLPDPYIKGRVCIPSPEGHGRFEYADSIVGEQYMDMISPWMRPDDEHTLMNFGGIGGAGDHTVYEIFKALEEVAISTAYIRFADGELTTSDNCRADLVELSSYSENPADTTLLEIADRCLVVSTDPEVDKIHIYTTRPLMLQLRPAHLAQSSSPLLRLQNTRFIPLAPGAHLLRAGRLTSFSFNDAAVQAPKAQ